MELKVFLLILFRRLKHLDLNCKI